MNDSVFLEQLDQYYALWQEYNAMYEEWAKAHGLSVNSLLVLSALHENQVDCTQKKISQRWLIPKQTVNMVLKDLAERAFVELRPMEMDKRNKSIHLTEAGKAHAAPIISELRAAELSVVAEIGLEQMRQLNASMATFVRLFREKGLNQAGGQEEMKEH